MIRRLFVEKKKEFAIEAKELLSDIKQTLNLTGLTSLRIINRYDVEGLDDRVYTRAKNTVFTEPNVDDVTDETLPLPEGALFFAVEYLPGQYDQRADSAAQCILLMEPDIRVKVRFAKIIALEGELTNEDVQKVKNYVINPVDSHEAESSKPKTLELETVRPDDVSTVYGFCQKDEKELTSYSKEMGFAMSVEDLLHIRKYYSVEEHRDPTLTELKVIDTYWSDHCRHTTFNTELTDICFETGPYGEMVKEAFDEYTQMRNAVYSDSEKSVCLMDMASIGTKYLKKIGKADDLDESEEINACSIKVKAEIDGREEDWLVMFKNETHNHPTEIEPFGGAATCLGGAIRDPLSGRAYVYQAMRVTGAADPRTPLGDTLPGKLSQRKITREAAKGYSSYGNQIGLATGQVTEIYHADYVAKRMEVGAVIGAAPANHVVRQRPSAGDVVILVGGLTGRDGCGGATGSSKEHTQDSILECGAEVQKGNPVVERNLQRLFRRREVTKLIKRCNDFGAGGVSVAVGELADGLDINLDLIPKKYEGLNGTELAISESQERMAVVVSKRDEKEFIAFANAENLMAATVAVVTDTNRIKMSWRGKEILDISRDFLNTNGARQHRSVKIKNQGSIDALKPFENAEDYLKDLNCASQKGLSQRFDSTIGTGTVLMPLGGKYQLSPAMGMAAKLPVLKGETQTTTLMTFGYDPQIAKASPFHGAVFAVLDSVTKIVAMGGDRKKIRLTFQEYFEKLSGDETWGKPVAALLGALKVQKELEIPAIGGKDSMSGTFMDINVPPALLSFAVTTADAREIISTEWKKPGSQIALIYTPRTQMDLPDFEIYKSNMDKVRELTKARKILSACALGKGGVFMGALKMAVGNKIGCRLTEAPHEMLTDFGYGNLLIEIDKDEDLQLVLDGTKFAALGVTTAETNIKIQEKGSEKNIDLNDAINSWESPLETVFPVRINEKENELDKKVEIAPTVPSNRRSSITKIAKPRILIPIFPGTNCETDSARAFERAGGETEIFTIRNLTSHDLNRSIDELAERIAKCQILMLPGGFSGGDEPDGSAKFITAIFRNPKISEKVAELLDHRDGLILGICNGFQALIKLGLVPYGKIMPQNEDSPTLICNKIGRHQSSFIRTRVASTLSPWLSGVNVGDIHTIPISHGEGNFICNMENWENLKNGGQVATQYVDFDGNPSMDIEFNPNHSFMAVEGITSPDGRVLGKMGHSERIGKNICKNISGNKDMKIFESGVAYFN